MIAPKNGNGEGHSTDILPKSKKVFLDGKLHPTIRVPLRRDRVCRQPCITPGASKSINGRVYDTSGPWSDPDFCTGTWPRDFLRCALNGFSVAGT